MEPKVSKLLKNKSFYEMGMFITIFTKAGQIKSANNFGSGKFAHNRKHLIPTEFEHNTSIIIKYGQDWEVLLHLVSQMNVISSVSSP
jgi:hypothetical protein